MLFKCLICIPENTLENTFNFRIYVLFNFYLRVFCCLFSYLWQKEDKQ